MIDPVRTLDIVLVREKSQANLKWIVFLPRNFDVNLR